MSSKDGTDSGDWTALLSGAPMQNPDTPGYHMAVLGGGPFGSPVSVCVFCGALVVDTDDGRQFHTRFHDGVRALHARDSA